MNKKTETVTKWVENFAHDLNIATSELECLINVLSPEPGQGLDEPMYSTLELLKTVVEKTQSNLGEVLTKRYPDHKEIIKNIL